MFFIGTGQNNLHIFSKIISSFFLPFTILATSRQTDIQAVILRFDQNTKGSNTCSLFKLLRQDKTFAHFQHISSLILFCLLQFLQQADRQTDIQIVILQENGEQFATLSWNDVMDVCVCVHPRARE